MEQILSHYEFINAQTGNVIAYLSITADMDNLARNKNLEKKKAELAIDNKLDMLLLYWQDKDHPIR